MFWLRSVSLSLLDYRLIAINALIYDLIATEIVNVNAHIVMGANGMTEFDKSATMHAPRTTTQILRQVDEAQRDALEISISRRSTAMSSDGSDNKAELAFFGQNPMHDGAGARGNRNIGFTLTPSGNSISFSSTRQTARSASEAAVVAGAVAGAAARPFDVMMTDNCSRFANSISVMPTINERVDNLRNDKGQIASAAMAGRNMKAVTGVLTTARTATATATTTTKTTTTAAATTSVAVAGAEMTAVSRQPAIKAAAAATAIATVPATVSETVSTSITTTAKTTMRSASKDATPTKPTKDTATTSSKASITMSKLLSTTTVAAAARTTTTSRTTLATRWWPTLHGHDLLSSTNGLPNCGVMSVCARAQKCHAATERSKTATPTTQTTTTAMAFVEPSVAIKSSATPAASLPSSPTTSILTAKVQANTAAVKATTTATATATTTHVTSYGGAESSPSPTKNSTAMAFHAHNNKTALTTTATPTAKPKQAPPKFRHLERALPAPMPAAPAEPTAATGATNLATATTTMSKIKTAKSTGALQLHWQRILSRHRRYLAFPEGASFSVSICITVGIIGNPRYDYMSFGLNWGVSYDLPNVTWVLNQLHGLSRRPTPMAVLHRRSKRALYERISEAVENMGYNGRECVLRTLCESRQYFARNKMGMIGEMLRVVFSLPKQRLFTRELRENSDVGVYDHAYRKARSVNCATHYDCSFSLLELAFGRYAKPPTDYYNKFGL